MAGRKSNFNGVLNKVRQYVTDGYKKHGDVTPSISGLSLYANCSRSSLYNYASNSEEFSDLLERIKARQEVELINKGLSGEFNSTIAKLMLSNYGYTERQQIDQNNNIRLNFNKPLSELFESK